MKIRLLILAASFIWDFGLWTPIVRNLMFLGIAIKVIVGGPTTLKDLIKPPRFM